MDISRASIDFDNFMECQSIAASTDEILWSDDETIIAEQEAVWNEGKVEEFDKSVIKTL